ncbi:MAG: excinuclease ABC subunit UvrC [Myxococcales bacterium]|nr:excinuclease ABC subunit UvrC [Myxococcales bacterium]
MYLFKSIRGRVLYVGKAQNLRSRVRQYVGGGDGRAQIPKLLERAEDVEVVVTPSAKDALLLENELIKRHRPPFNVRLRDDKQYLALRLDPQQDWPRLTQVRRFVKDGALYFGPYTSSVAMHEVVSGLRRIFPLRSCSDSSFRDYQRRGRPCIEYEMKRCVGPCCDLTDRERYAELVRGTVLFLRGRSGKLVAQLRARMDEASTALDFEEAARLRDQIGAVERTLESQQIVTESAVDRDVFGLARHAGDVEVRVLKVREGRVVESYGYGLTDVMLDDGMLMGSFLAQYYGAGSGREVPREILTPCAPEDDGVLVEWLREQAGRAVGLRVPRRGKLHELLGMAIENAELGLGRRLQARESVVATLEELKERLALPKRPDRIEGYDVSTLQGTLSVASRVVFEDGLPCKADYRRYKIRQAAPDDDYACLREVFQRRLARLEQEPLPDLFLVDGGKGQLGVLRAALDDVGCDTPAISIAKERDEESRRPRVKRSGGLKAERIFLPERKDPVRLAPNSRGLLLLQRVRDESHRFAIEFQRSLRSKRNFASLLEELPGIGPKKRAALLRELGSLRAVKEASEEVLAAVSGVSAGDAQRLRAFLDEFSPE